MMMMKLYNIDIHTELPKSRSPMLIHGSNLQERELQYFHLQLCQNDYR